MEHQTFFQHYLQYLLSSKGLFSILVAFPVLLYLQQTALKPSGKTRIPGCLRMGLRGKSNLDDQYTIKDRSAGLPRVKAIYVYPVKSCRAVELAASDISRTGLSYDRMFSFAQYVPAKHGVGDETSIVDSEGAQQWRFITQREFPKLALLTTELWVPDPRREVEAGRHGQRTEKRTGTIISARSEGSKKSMSDDWVGQGGCLLLSFPYQQKSTVFGERTEIITMKIPLTPSPQRVREKKYTSEPIAIWKDCPMSLNVSNEIDPNALAKLKEFLGVKNTLGLFRVDCDNLREISRSLPKDHLDEKFNVGFADAFPVHLLSLASVRAVDEDLPPNASTKGKLDAVRFRANIYVDGVTASAEDQWMKIAIGRALAGDGKFGPAGYHVACRTARCTLPNVHPGSGVKDRNEPHATLKRTRQVDEGAKPHPCLGLSMIPLFTRGIIRVGDEIDVLQIGEHCYEKMFS
ncbi:Mitochondrial amidoxime-reducing component 1 [Lecanosticta acicola]|uniref:Mitochondrial amidoxime-reducing component 1 n=1 Tax=Lecanosticta acicola TaxID=111012 RepID=A0AAI9EEH7_9PEZI|nr:Mitochondrial amidoxime-reducing component 1 [Lecanosticta acicola]